MNQFPSRLEAGEYLAKMLTKYKDQEDALILALPRGGVPVAYEIAVHLNVPLDVFLVRKLGVPGHEEYAMGAIAEGGFRLLHGDVMHQLGIPDSQVQQVIAKEKQELEIRMEHYRQGRSLPSLIEKTVILVDDGIATGATMRVAVEAVKVLEPKNIVVAVPVASQEAIRELQPLVESVVCPFVPEPFYGVGRWYGSFPQTSDEEVIQLLTDAVQRLNQKKKRYES